MSLIKACLPKAALFFVFFAVLTGVAYTGFITGVAQLFFPAQANGSVIVGNDGNRYSMLLGQTFTQDKYLWGRIQDFDFAIPRESPFNSNSDWIPHSHGDRILMYSWASNRSPAGDADLEGWGTRDREDLMQQQVAARVAWIRERNPEMGNTPIPVALVTNSGSGLDPHIPPAAAEFQVARIARARGISEDEVRAIISRNTRMRVFGVFGEPTVHVLRVNLMLDGILQ